MATIISRRGRRGTRYQVRVRIAGVALTKTLASAEEARAWAALTEGRLRAEQLGLVPASAIHTVADVVARYERDVLPTKPEATAANYRRHLRWWRRRIGKKTLSELTRDDIITHRTRLARSRSARTTAPASAAAAAATRWPMAAATVPRRPTAPNPACMSWRWTSTAGR